MIPVPLLNEALALSDLKTTEKEEDLLSKML